VTAVSIKAGSGAFREWGGAVQRLGGAGGVLIVTAALALAACGGSGDSALKANATATTATTIINQLGGGGTGGGTTGAGTPHGTATSTPHGTSVSNPHGTTTSTLAATTTTRLNTIKPLPGRPVPPTFVLHYTGAYPQYGFDTQQPNGQIVGTCSGTPPGTEMDVHWETLNADFVEISRGSTNYPASGDVTNVEAECLMFFSTPIASVVLTAFGPGGEVSQEVTINVDPHLRP
jgi:hypothetical protein